MSLTSQFNKFNPDASFLQRRLHFQKSWRPSKHNMLPELTLQHSGNIRKLTVHLRHRRNQKKSLEKGVRFSLVFHAFYVEKLKLLTGATLGTQAQPDAGGPKRRFPVSCSAPMRPMRLAAAQSYFCQTYSGDGPITGWKYPAHGTAKSPAGYAKTFKDSQ